MLVFTEACTPHARACGLWRSGSLLGLSALCETISTFGKRCSFYNTLIESIIEQRKFEKYMYDFVVTTVPLCRNSGTVDIRDRYFILKDKSLILYGFDYNNKSFQQDWIKFKLFIESGLWWTVCCCCAPVSEILSQLNLMLFARVKPGYKSCTLSSVSFVVLGSIVMDCVYVNSVFTNSRVSFYIILLCNMYDTTHCCCFLFQQNVSIIRYPKCPVGCMNLVLSLCHDDKIS